jgi:hypothetical protein
MNKPGTVKTRVWQDESRLATVVTWIATTTALIVALAAPLGYFLLSREAELRDAAMAARLHAAFVTQLVSASPDDWRQDVGGLLDTDLAPSDVPEQRRVEDSAHVVLATAGAVLHGPVVERAALVTGPEGPVGAVVIARSLKPILTQTGLVALLGVALGLSIYGSLRVLPLRALRRTWRHCSGKRARPARKPKSTCGWCSRMRLKALPSSRRTISSLPATRRWQTCSATPSTPCRACASPTCCGPFPAPTVLPPFFRGRVRPSRFVPAGVLSGGDERQ